MHPRPLIQIVSAAEGFALAGAAGVILLQALDAGAALEFRRSLIAQEPWRLASGNLVHAGWRHALLNAAAWPLIARLFAAELAPHRQCLLIGASCVVIGALLYLLVPQLAWYRGLSGVLHALFAAGSVDALQAAGGGKARRLPALLLAGVWAKVLAEQAFGAAPAEAAWLGAPLAPAAHLFGAACGTLMALTLRPRPRN